MSLEELIWDGKEIATKDKSEVKAIPINTPLILPRRHNHENFIAQVEKNVPAIGNVNAYSIGITISVGKGVYFTAVQYYRIEK